MDKIIDHSRKVKRAYALSQIGAHPESRHAMLDALPASALDALTAAQLAEMLDAMWALAVASKAARANDVLAEGGIWDGTRFRELAA